MPATQMPGTEGCGQLLRRKPLQKPMDSLSVPARRLNESQCLMQWKDERVILCEWKQMGSSRRWLLSCEGAVRESGALGTVRTGPVHSALPHQLVVSSVGGESGSGGSSCGNMNCERLPDGASGAGEIARGRRGRAMGWNATSVRHYRCLRDEHCQMPSEWSVYVPDFSDHELQWHLCQATSGLQSLVLMHWERQCLWNEMNSVELLRLIYASYFQ